MDIACEVDGGSQALRSWLDATLEPLPLTVNPTSLWVVRAHGEALTLAHRDRPDWQPLNVLQLHAQRCSRQGQRQHPLYRALRRQHLAYASKGCRLRIWDATAGLGLDARAMLSWGMEVISVERHPLVFLMLAHAHAFGDNCHWQVRWGDGGLAKEAWDMAYIDPMFAQASRAKMRKPMQLLQALHGAQRDEAWDLFQALGRQGPVLVKRPKHTRPWPGHLATTFEGKAFCILRYDGVSG